MGQTQTIDKGRHKKIYAQAKEQVLTEKWKQLHILQLCNDRKADSSQLTDLLSQDINLNIHDEEGRHPLWIVSKHGRSDLVKCFLQHNAEVNLTTTDKYGETALITASTYGHIETTKVLLENGAFINYLCDDGLTALYFASKNNHIAVVGLLLEKGAHINKGTKTPLYGASFNGRLNVIKILLDYGAKVNLPNIEAPYSTPLSVACSKNHYEVAQLLINKGANVNRQKKDGWTPLHRAANRGHTKMVRLLLLYQANPNVKTNLGNTTLHLAVENGHIEVVKLLLMSHANLNIKDNAGWTPLQLAEKKEYSEIITLLRKIVSPAEASLSVHYDDGEKELFVDDLIRQDEADHIFPDALPLAKVPKEDYVCVIRNSLCLVYLPQGINKQLSLKTVTDTIHPKIASHEIRITPVVCITSDNMSLSPEKPAIIELSKTIELSDEEASGNKIILLCSSTESSEWEEMQSECNCKIFNSRISFEVTHFSVYVVISRKPLPTSSVKVKPSTDIHASDESSTPTELTIPELPGFKVCFPSSSVNTDREIDITATIHYDCPAVCSEDDRSCLASSCIELEPHGITFSKEVSISIPILNYAEVKESHPNAQLQIWQTNKHSNSLTELDWNLVIHSICRDEEGRHVAIVLTKHFSWYKSLWDTYTWAKSLFYAPFGIKERCQVFMSQETQIIHSGNITFSIAVLFYPYKEEPEPVPCNYKYMLVDSGLLDLEVSNDDTLHFEVKLNEHLSPKKYKSLGGSLVIFGRQQKSFTIELDGLFELQGGFPMGELSIGVQEHNHHTLTLIKPIINKTSDIVSSQASSLPSTTIAYQFEENIIAIEDAAEKLGEDATQYADNPGPMVEATRRIASMWRTMAQLLRKECVLKEWRFKEDIVDLARNINKESQEVLRIAASVAEECTDKTMKTAVYGMVERLKTISHQLRILAAGEVTRRRDETSDLEACQMLTTNAKNLISAISEALYHTQRASIRVAMATRIKLGLTDPITGNLSQYYKVNDDIDGDHYQDSHEGSEGHIQQSTKDGGHLSLKDLQKVQNSIWDARVQWYNLGLGLGITPDSLDAIELDNGQKLDRCFRAMLTQWLREHPRPTWSALAEALKSPSVGYSHLAEEILDLNL